MGGPRWALAVVAALLVAATLLQGPGCETWDSAAVTAEAARARADADRLDGLAAVAEPGPERDRAAGLAAELRAAAGRADALRAEVEAGAAQVDAAAAAARGVASLVPVPFGSEALSLLAGAAVGWLGRARPARSFRQLVRAIDAAKAANPALAAALGQSRDALRAGLDLDVAAAIDRERVGG